MDPHELLYSMRADETQTDEAIRAFVDGVVDGTVTRPQAASWITHVYRRGLSDAETVALTRAMTASGTVLSWPDGPTLADKHSTGGVGDKVSLILAPLWAELGYRVPMLSGRGLGHTGGTLDKLESIPGFRTDLDEDALRAVLADTGCFISGQTERIAPADRILYALRNEVCCVESNPLIVGSILSKKLAEGVQRLVLDVKTGSGAFMQTEEAAVALAVDLVRVAVGAGLDCEACITAMDRPLGQAVGNAVEVVESVATLQGDGPEDLRALVLALTDDPRAAEVLRSGRAYERFARMVAAQGGDTRALEKPKKLAGRGASEAVMVAERSGWVQAVDARGIADAAFVLGAGRIRSDDPVDPGVGLWVHAEIGQPVAEGQPIATLLHRDGKNLARAFASVKAAVVIGDSPATATPLVRRRIRAADVL
ncbi:MAG: thymidine phosphorylase [Alphaproteobacteria bacterium]|nr:thymidine phosphorylase [Alphaproteobacteria bacterium]